MKYANKIGVAAVALALSVTLAPAAFAVEKMAPIEHRSIQWTSAQEMPAFEKTITIGGETYTLTGEPAIKEIKSETGLVSAEHTETVQCWPGELDGTIARFAESWHVDEEDAEGDIPKTDVNYAPVYGERSWEVNATQSYQGLPTNDVAQIVREITYTNPETGHALMLALASINWSVTSQDASGMATSYTANCIYRGVDTDNVLDHYVVTANYAGDVNAKTAVTTYEATLTYQGPETIESARGREEEEIPVAAVVAAAIAAVAAATGIIVPIVRRKSRVRFVHVAWDRAKKRTTKTTVYSAKVTQSGNKCTVDAGDAELNVLGLGNYCVALVPAKYVGHGYVLTITQHGRVVFEGEVNAPEIKIVASR